MQTLFSTVKATLKTTLKTTLKRCLALGLCAVWLSGPAAAQSLLRDSEIEEMIAAYTYPLLTAAGLDVKVVSINIVNDNSINAFVALGQRIFMNSGTILKADTPNEIIGVLAHETGHIMGGHLARSGDAISKASNAAILAYILGAAAIAAGDARAGSAIIASAQDFAGRSYLKYTRGQEASADQAAIRLLRATGQSPEGLSNFMRKLANVSASFGRSIPIYYQSHPQPRDRASVLDRAVKDSPFASVPPRPEYVEMLARAKAKLRGFLFKPETTLNLYPLSDQSIPAKYARAIAYHQDARLELAMAELDALIQAEPENPFFHELKGQIYFETGHIEDSLAPYERAVELRPKDALLRIGLGQSQVASEDPKYYPQAIRNLERALRRDTNNTSAWMQLASAYGKTNQIGKATLATAERYLRGGAVRDAKIQAERALSRLKEETPSWHRARDIIDIIESHQAAARQR